MVPLAVAALLATAHSVAAQVPFDNFNIYGVINGPRTTTRFAVPTNTSARITQLVNYHWNSSAAPAPMICTPSKSRLSRWKIGFSIPVWSPRIWPRAISRYCARPTSYGTPS
jgi:hypothetical protein